MLGIDYDKLRQPPHDRLCVGIERRSRAIDPTYDIGVDHPVIRPEAGNLYTDFDHRAGEIAARQERQVISPPRPFSRIRRSR